VVGTVVDAGDDRNARNKRRHTVLTMFDRAVVIALVIAGESPNAATIRSEWAKFRRLLWLMGARW